MTALQQWLFPGISVGGGGLSELHKFTDRFYSNGNMQGRAPRLVNNTLAVAGVDFSTDSGPTWSAVGGVADYGTSGGHAILKHNVTEGSQYQWIFGGLERSNSIAITLQGFNLTDGDDRRVSCLLMGPSGALTLEIDMATPAAPEVRASYTSGLDTVANTYLPTSISQVKPITLLFAPNGTALAIDGVIVQTWAYTMLTVERAWNTIDLYGGNYADLSVASNLDHVGIHGSVATTLAELQAEIGMQTLVAELFANDLVDYTVTTPPSTMYTQTAIIGKSIVIPSSLVVSDITESLGTTYTANRLDFRVKVIASSNDDGGILRLLLDTTTVFGFVARREGYYDALRRHRVGVHGNECFQGAAAATIGVWYRVKVFLIPGSGLSYCELWDATPTLIATTVIPGDHSGGISFNKIQWATDATSFSPSTATEYEAIYIQNVIGG